VAAQQAPPASAAWVGLLPDGEAKRRFLLDCATCHQLDSAMARPDGKPRSRAQWAEAVRRMLKLAGPGSRYPVIGPDRDPDRTAAWLDSVLGRPGPSRGPAEAPGLGVARSRTYPLPDAGDSPQDLALDSVGQVLVLGQQRRRLYRLNPVTETFRAAPLPAGGEPRAVAVDPTGNWWVLFRGPGLLARYIPASDRWSTWPVPVEPRSLALDAQGHAWFNGYFSRSPELIGRVMPETGRAQTFAVPPHPTLAMRPAGPIPEALRVGPDGAVWGSESDGNRIFAFAPATRRFASYTLPEPFSGPLRFDLDSAGTLWIPAFAANSLIRFDPVNRRFAGYPLPLADALPFVVRADPRRGAVWIGTAAADALLRFDPSNARFTVYPLPVRGAIVRQIAIDPVSGDLWLACSGRPGGAPGRVVRIRAQ
jgi:streptogramin lyase